MLSVQKNRKKNQLFANGIGKYNAKQILANINNSASLLMEQFVSNSMNITVLSDIEFDNKYGVNTDGVYEVIAYGKDEANNWSPVHIIST